MLFPRSDMLCATEVAPPLSLTISPPARTLMPCRIRVVLISPKTSLSSRFPSMRNEAMASSPKWVELELPTGVHRRDGWKIEG